jgi:hypothetical protein
MTQTLTDDEITDVLRERNEALAAKQATYPPPACPVWCREPAGHPYDSIERPTLTMSRTHWAFSTGHKGHPGVSLFVRERNVDGVIELEPPAIATDMDIEADYTGAEIRAWVAQMVEMADLYDAITRLPVV